MINVQMGLGKNMLFMVNSIFFSSYIIMVKPLTKKYHTITIMKWLFLMGFIMTFPITVGEFSVINWSDLPFNIVWRILFVIVGTTFLTYLLNLFALKNLQASTVGAFAYAQPIIAIAFAVFSGNDYLDIFKAFACITIMVGVYLVSKKSSKAS